MLDQLSNGLSKNLEDTLTDCDRQKMADSLMLKLEQQALKSDSSDEESQEHKNLMFEDAASSAGSRSLSATCKIAAGSVFAETVTQFALYVLCTVRMINQSLYQQYT